MKEDDESVSTAAHCPPTVVLMMIGTGELGEPYAESALQHIRGCPTCRLKVSGFLGFLDEAEIELESPTAEGPEPAGWKAAAIIGDWRRMAYNCGDPERQPRCHLVATRRLTLASVGPTCPDSTSEYDAQLQPIDWSWGNQSPQTTVRADDLEELAGLLRVASDSTGRTTTVFLPAETAWLVEPFLLDAGGKWRVFIADTTPRGRARRPLMKCDDEISGMTYQQVETWPEEGVRMSRWLLEKQGIGAGRLAGITFAALGRVLGRGDSDQLVPADDPLMIVIPVDDPPVDDDDLFAMYAQGHRDLISTP